jgi:uncharacterized protein
MVSLTSAIRTKSMTVGPLLSCPASRSVTTHALGREHQAEVLSFLAARPLYTVIMAGLIRDNGLVSPLNRGSFYACRNYAGEIEGVLLLGHATLFETRTTRALEALAGITRHYTKAHMLAGERDELAAFWDYCREDGKQVRLTSNELLLELRHPVEVHPSISGLRLAAPADLDAVVPVQSEMAYMESGINPLDKDPEGFRRRCARRIALGRTWVLVEGGKLIFKTEVQAETPLVSYLEGVYVAPSERGRGKGLKCLAQLHHILLRNVPSLCLYVNEQNWQAQAFYRKAGYRLRGHYDTIYLQRNDS